MTLAMLLAILSNAAVLLPDIRMVLFFFSSRRRHTRFDCDWSSDVCSSDLSSFELVDFDEVVASTSDTAFAPGAVVSGGPANQGGQGGKGPPPIPQGTPQGLAPVAPEMAPPPRDTAAMRAIEQKSRGLRGFWFGAMF